MVELRRNKKTGIVESFRNGKKIGEVITMGDSTKEKKRKRKNELAVIKWAK